MTKERIRRLDALGFIWDYDLDEQWHRQYVLLEALGFPWSIQDVWFDNFEKLKAFYASEGRWPASREGRLGSWCAVQRRLYKKGRLGAERQEKLERIGFDFHSRF